VYLSQLRASLQDQIDFTPQNTQGIIQSLNNMLNEAYYSLWFEHPWLFNTREHELGVFPDLDAATSLLWFTGETDPTATPLVTQISKNTFTWIYTGVQLDTDFYKRINADMLQQLYGAWLTIENRDYQIVDIQIGNVGGIGPANTFFTFYVDQPFYGEYASGVDIEFTDWTIKFKTYKLPEDLFEIQDVSFRDNRDVAALRWGKIPAVTAREGVRFAFPYQITTSLPAAYVPGAFMPLLTDGQEEFTTIATNVGTPAFPAGTYFFAWERMDLTTGATLGMSVPITITFGAATIDRIDFVPVTSLPEGQIRRLLIGQRTSGKTNSEIKWRYAQWYNDNVNPLAQIITDPTDSANKVNPTIWHFYDSSVRLTAAQYRTLMTQSTSGQLNTNYRGNSITNYIGPTDRKTITFYPRPQNINFSINDPDGRPWKIESMCTVRYSYRPQELKNEYDTPALPPEMHYLIVKRALVSAFNKFNKPAQANAMLTQYNKELAPYITRYSSERDTKVRLQQSWGGHRPYDNLSWSTVSYTSGR